MYTLCISQSSTKANFRTDIDTHPLKLQGILDRSPSTPIFAITPYVENAESIASGSGIDSSSRGLSAQALAPLREESPVAADRTTHSDTSANSEHSHSTDVNLSLETVGSQVRFFPIVVPRGSCCAMLQHSQWRGLDMIWEI